MTENKMNKAKKKLVVLTGAGMSAESGLRTFRDSDGLWEGYNVLEVATPGGFAANPQLVLDFYNMRRKDVANAKPNIQDLQNWKLIMMFRSLPRILTICMKEVAVPTYYTYMVKSSKCAV